MKKISIVAALLGAFALAGCHTIHIGSTVNLNSLEGVVSAYGLLLNAENTYKALPLCKTKTKPSLTNICAQRSIIVRLQKADKIANAAVNQAVAFVSQNPNVDPSQYISAARDAMTALQVVMQQATATGM